MSRRGVLTQSNHTVTKSAVVLLVMAAAILLLGAPGCGGGEATQTSATDAGTTAPADSVSDLPTQSAEVVVADAPDPSPLDLPHLGDVSYQIDETVEAVSAQTSVKEDTILKLTDGRGLTYELVIPAGAIAQRIPITMRGLTGLSSTNVPGELLGGVLLEPDGLRFAAPASLTVTGTGMGESIRILTGKEDGTNIDLAEQATAGGGVGATLWHLSPYLISDWENVAGSVLESQVKATAKALLDRINALLKDPQIKVTPPPSVSLECSDEVTEMLEQQLLDLWLRSADDPEGELLRAAVSAAHEYQVQGLDDTALFQAAQKLLLRQKARAEKLIQQYGSDREKMLAIGTYGLIVARNMDLVGGLEAEEQALGAKVANYVASFVDGLIDDIRTKHDYKMMRVAILVGKWANLLGVNEGKFDETAITERVFAAMQFKVETTFTFNWPEQEWVLKSSADIQFELGGSIKFAGGGTGIYVSYVGPASVPMTGPDFPVTVALEDFDPCSGTATFSIDRHSADSEQYDFGDGDVETLDLAKISWESVFESRLEDGMYRFPVTLQNGQAVAIDESPSGTSPSGEVTGTLQIKVTHVPK